ncbi:MAG: hypothetical protein AAF065_00830 [Verrucomicrobiota bacterium]
MFRALAIIFVILQTVVSATASTDEIELRLHPDEAAPIVSTIVATEKVLLDAVPADEDWLTLKLDIPFEGYVPTATLNKNFAIVPGTAVRHLPSGTADMLTEVAEGDIYEILNAKDGWTTAGFIKRMTVFYKRPAPAEPIIENAPEPPVLNLVPLPEPLTIDEPKPEQPTPAEPIEWQGRRPTPNRVLNRTWRPAPPIIRQQPYRPVAAPEYPEEYDDIMVGPEETQVGEKSKSTPESDKALRLLTGILVREITAEGPTYPVRLRSPDGRLIAYVDFSGIFIEDLNPFLKQRVYLRGQIFPVKPNDSQLVIFAKEIQLAD